MSNVIIRDIRVILTAPAGVDLVVVKVETSEPGLYGLGCATFTQRYTAVATAVQDYLRPLLIGRCVNNIEDIWQLSMSSSYWRNSAVLNNAISGVDEALWDIKGKMANMPVYELLGGRCRNGAAVYRHADGATPEAVEENVRKYMAEGYRYIRCQLGTYGGQMNERKQEIVSPDGAPRGAYYDPKQYMRDVIGMFEHLRSKLGDKIEFIHDVHERLSPADTVRFAKDLEPYRLFFLEDSLAPEHLEWLENIRMHSALPIAIGELFNHPLEWKEIVSRRLIDFIRVHISQIGGLSPARKLANFCEAYAVRTAWHGPNDLSPVGAAAQLHLDVSAHNFGIQEAAGFSEAEQEVFSGCPVIRDGYMYPNEAPGFGVDIDEAKAAKYPCEQREHFWLHARLPDGTAVRP